MVTINVDKEKCIGCMLCAANFPHIFTVKDGKASINQDAIPTEEDADMAKTECPVGAIK